MTPESCEQGVACKLAARRGGVCSRRGGRKPLPASQRAGNVPDQRGAVEVAPRFESGDPLAHWPRRAATYPRAGHRSTTFDSEFTQHARAGASSRSAAELGLPRRSSRPRRRGDPQHEEGALARECRGRCGRRSSEISRPVGSGTRPEGRHQLHLVAGSRRRRRRNSIVEAVLGPRSTPISRGHPSGAGESLYAGEGGRLRSRPRRPARASARGVEADPPLCSRSR